MKNINAGTVSKAIRGRYYRDTLRERHKGIRLESDQIASFCDLRAFIYTHTIDTIDIDLFIS